MSLNRSCHYLQLLLYMYTFKHYFCMKTYIPMHPLFWLYQVSLIQLHTIHILTDELSAELNCGIESSAILGKIKSAMQYLLFKNDSYATSIKSIVHVFDWILGGWGLICQSFSAFNSLFVPRGVYFTIY